MDQKNVKKLKKSGLSLLGIMAMIYSFVAAGPFGTEEAVSAIGPGLTIVLLIIFPFVWGLPLSEMVGELSSIYPDEGGIYSWTIAAFGEFWGWQVGFWAGFTTWLCQAQYCAMATGYAAKIFDMSPDDEYMWKVIFVLIFSLINIIGLKQLADMETLFTVLVLIGSVAVTAVGFAHWEFDPFTPFYNDTETFPHALGEGVAIVIWMYCGYECMSNLSEECENPQLIPKAMRLSQPLIALVYVLPLIAGLASVGQWEYWAVDQADGGVGFADVLLIHVGDWAGYLFIFIAIISTCALFSSYVAHGSRSFFVMADDHLFPSAIKRVDRRGVPTFSIIILAVFTIITCRYDFTTLVMATTTLQLYIYLMLVACTFKIRKIVSPKIRRQQHLTTMPGGMTGLILAGASVTLISLFSIYASGTDYFVAGFSVLLFGLAAYVFCKKYYGGLSVREPEKYPVNPRTGLGVGDMAQIGLYTLLMGLFSLAGYFFLGFYEGSYGEEYYLEEYGEGLFSNFTAMLDICLWFGIAAAVIGGAVWYFWKDEKVKSEE